MVLDRYAVEVELDPPGFDFSEGGLPRPPYGSRPSFHGCRCTKSGYAREAAQPRDRKELNESHWGAPKEELAFCLILERVSGCI